MDKDTVKDFSAWLGQVQVFSVSRGDPPTTETIADWLWRPNALSFIGGERAHVLRIQELEAAPLDTWRGIASDGEVFEIGLLTSDQDAAARVDRAALQAKIQAGDESWTWIHLSAMGE